MESFNFELFLPSPTGKIEFQAIKKNPDSIPDNPGFYIFEREENDYSYSGKGESIRARIKAHIKKSHNEGLNNDIKENKIKHIIYFLCDSELDATILERYFIQGNYYRGEHNIQFTKKEEKTDYEEIISKDEYENLLKKENEEVEKMLEEDEEIKIKMFEQLEERINDKIKNNRAGRKNISKIYAKEMFRFLFQYIKYTKQPELNWTKFKQDLQGKINEDFVLIIDDLCVSKHFRCLLKPFKENEERYVLGKYKFEIRKEIGKDIYYFVYTAPHQYNNKFAFNKHRLDLEKSLSPQQYINTYIKKHK